MFYFATESGDHVIKILICDWSVFNVVVVFVRWNCKFYLYFWLLKLFNLFSLFNMSWTDSETESLITFYSSMLVSGARNFATGVKNRRQKPTPVFWCRFLAPVSGACVIGISVSFQRVSRSSTILFCWLCCCLSSLKLLSVVGEGQFGVVMKAEAYNVSSSAHCLTVAVKMLKGTSYQIEQYKYVWL